MNQKLCPQDVLVRLEGSAVGPEHGHALTVGIAALMCAGTPYQVDDHGSTYPFARYIARELQALQARAEHERKGII